MGGGSSGTRISSIALAQRAARRGCRRQSTVAMNLRMWGGVSSTPESMSRPWCSACEGAAPGRGFKSLLVHIACEPLTGLRCNNQ